MDIHLAKIQSSTVQSLLRLKQLSRLELYGTPITDEAIESLRQMKSLTYLNVEKTMLTQQGVEELRKALPECDIRY